MRLWTRRSASGWLVANVTRQDERTAWVEVRLPRALFDQLGVAYGTRGRALAAMREALPDLILELLTRAPSPPPGFR